jgi:hypothetical protein
MPPKKGTSTPNNPLDSPTWNLNEGEELHNDTNDLQNKAVTKDELQSMQDSIEAKMEVIMDTNMDGLKGDIMEGLKKFPIERPPECDNVSHEIHDEEKRKMNQG